MKIFIFFAQPVRYYAIEADGQIAEQGNEAQLLESQLLTSAQAIIGVLPGEFVTIKQLDLPIKQRSKLLKALPFALENDILGDIELQHLTLVDWGNNKPVFVSICEDATIEKYRLWAKENGIILSSLIPDFALYQINEAHPYHLIERDAQNSVLIENNYLRSICENSFLQPAIRNLVSQDGDFDVQTVSVSSTRLLNSIKAVPGLEFTLDEQADRSLQLVLADYYAQKHSPFELLTDEYAPPSVGIARNGLTIAAAVLGVVFLAKIVFDHWLSYRINSEMEHLTQDAQAAIAQVFPSMRQLPSLSTTNFQMDQRIAGLRGSSDVSNEFLYLLQQLTVAVQRNNSELEQITYRNNALVFNAKVAQFSQLQNLETALRTSGDIDVRLISSGNEGNRVNARYEIRLK